MNLDDQRNFERVAYHESGHAAIAYLSGYTCDWITLLLSEPGTGGARLNYDDDLLLIAGIPSPSTALLAGIH